MKTTSPAQPVIFDFGREHTFWQISRVLRSYSSSYCESLLECLLRDQSLAPARQPEAKSPRSSPLRVIKIDVEKEHVIREIAYVLRHSTCDFCRAIIRRLRERDVSSL